MRAPLAAALLVCCGCGVVDSAVASKIIEDQEKVRTYQGLYEERGTVPGEPDTIVRSAVRFQAPSSFVVEVLSPDRFRGDTIAYLDSQLILYSAHFGAGIRIRGVPWDQERWREWVRATVAYDRAHYDFEAAPQPDTIANRVAKPYYVRPGALWWLDEEFSVLLRLEMPGLYSMRFAEVAFNRPMERPTFEPPPETQWLEWDMQAPPISIEEARHYVNFPLLEPAEPPLGLERTKIVWVTTDVLPLLALVYEKGPFYASIAECRDEGFKDPNARGVVTDLGDTKGLMSGVGSMSLLTFIRRGVLVTIASNLPPSEILALARNLR